MAAPLRSANTAPPISLPHPASAYSVGPVLGELFAHQGLRRGGVFELRGTTGVTSLLFALVGGTLTSGQWAAVIGVPTAGIEAAVGYGIPLERLIMVPDPGRAWIEAAAGMLTACDLVAICLPEHCSAQVARQLVARARRYESVLLVVRDRGVDHPRQMRWPDAMDGCLEVRAAQWRGLQKGHGVLAERQVELRFSGRRAAVRGRSMTCLLPTATGGIATTSPVAIPDVHEHHAIAMW